MPAKPNTGDSTGTTRWVAVEGPCCAGKSTLTQGLLNTIGGSDAIRIVQVRCYADHVGGGRLLPRPVPASLPEDQAALTTLLAVEHHRVAYARAAACEVVLMDRSVYTLLAHRAALQRVTGLPLLAPAERAIARSAAPAWPELVLYLDVPHRTVLDRNRGKFAPDSIFIDPGFNAGVRSYFADLTHRRAATIVWLDATDQPAQLVSIAAEHIRELLQGRDT